VSVASEAGERAFLSWNHTAERVGRSQLGDDATAVRDEENLTRRHISQGLAQPRLELSHSNRFHVYNVVSRDYIEKSPLGTRRERAFVDVGHRPVFRHAILD
jgi:hypothetical protein